MRSYFNIYQRTLKSGNKKYYYQTYNPDGTLSSGKSTGCKTKKEAIHYCETLLMQGRLWSGSNISFSNYAEHFFDIDSIWVQDRIASGTKEHPALSPLYLKKLQSTVRLHFPDAGNGGRLRGRTFRPLLLQAELHRRVPGTGRGNSRGMCYISVLPR